MSLLGKILKVSLLLINAIAVLSEDRFLARRTCSVTVDWFIWLTLFHPSWLGPFWSTPERQR